LGIEKEKQEKKGEGNRNKKRQKKLGWDEIWPKTQPKNKRMTKYPKLSSQKK